MFNSWQFMLKQDMRLTHPRSQEHERSLTRKPLKCRFLRPENRKKSLSWHFFLFFPFSLFPFLVPLRRIFPACTRIRPPSSAVHRNPSERGRPAAERPGTPNTFAGKKREALCFVLLIETWEISTIPTRWHSDSPRLGVGLLYHYIFRNRLSQDLN